ATDVLAGMGPAPVKKGDRIAIGAPVTVNAGPDEERLAVAAVDLPRSGDLVYFDVIPGPRDDWFDVAALDRLVSQDWVVTPQSNRVGMRLAGAEPLARSRQGELPSEGTVAGAIQVPAGGQPVLFLADQPLTGGYPVIGAAIGRVLYLPAPNPPVARPPLDRK